MSVHQQNALEFGIWSKSLYQKDQHVLEIWLRTYSIYRLWETDYLTNSFSFHGVMSWLFILLPNGHLGQYTQRRYLQKVSSQLCALLQCKSTNSRGDVGIDYCISVLQCLLDLLQRSTLFGHSQEHLALRMYNYQMKSWANNHKLHDYLCRDFMNVWHERMCTTMLHVELKLMQ